MHAGDGVSPQHSMHLSELYELVSLQSGEEFEKQHTKSRNRYDNANMNSVTITLNNTCNPFANNAPAGLVIRKSCKCGDQRVSPWNIGVGENSATSI